jgi:DNA-directed RNA polymerase specialized sigma24 family protein
LRDPDEVLAARAAHGDRRALEALLERHADRVHALCRRVIGHPEDALDATQVAMISIARGHRALRRPLRVHDMAVSGGDERGTRRTAPQPTSP